MVPVEVHGRIQAMKGFVLPRVHFTSILPVFFSILLFSSAWLIVYQQWLTAEQDNSHAFPAFLAAIFIALTCPFQLANANRILRVASYFILIVILSGYFIAQMVNIEILMYAGLILGLIVLFNIFFGFQNWSKSALIIFLLTLSLPIWDALLEPLVRLASAVVTHITQYLNIAVLIEGNSITTPYGRILIAEGCAGIRYLLVSIVFSAIISHLNHYNTASTLLSLAIGALIGLVANWVRILVLILVGYYSNMQSGLMHDHEFFGWIVFAIFILPAMYFAPHSKKPSSNLNQRLRSSSMRPLIFIAFLCLINFGITTVLNIQVSKYSRTQPPVIKLPQWQVSSLPPSFAQLPIHINQQMSWYSLPQKSLYVGTLQNHKKDQLDKLVPYIPQSLVSELWYVEKIMPLTVGDTEFSGQILKSFKDGKRVFRAQAFHTGDNWTSNYAQAKIMQIPALLTGNNSFTYYLFLADCHSHDCGNVISEMAQNIIQLKTP